MKENRIYTGAAGKILDHWRSNCFLKIDTEDDKTRSADNLFQYFTTRTEKASLLRRGGLGPPVICRRALVARLRVGEG